MKINCEKWLLVSWLSLVVSVTAQASGKIAIVSIDSLFQQVAQEAGVSEKLENEFKSRANELQHMEDDLQSKRQRLQRDGSKMEANERSRLEKDVMSQLHIFSQKAQEFEQDRQRFSNREHGKLITCIQAAVKKVATDEKIDLVIDTNAIAFNGNNVKDITNDVLNKLDRSCLQLS